ncbi:MAG: hypothetical protein IIA88_06905 [Bacteroidetes bacterium]|nr:hypothetical protein [Bacteroidota bacterium]
MDLLFNCLKEIKNLFCRLPRQMAGLCTMRYALCAFFLFPYDSFPQESSAVMLKAPVPAKNVVKIIPFQFFLNTFQCEWEIATKNKSSITIIPSITAKDKSGFNQEKILGAGLGITRKFYLEVNRENLDGFYGAIHASYKYFEAERINYYWYPGTDTVHVYLHTIEFNLLMGYQAIISEIVAIDLYMGGGLRKATINNDDTYYKRFLRIGYSGVNPKIGFSIGIIF